MAPTCVTHFSIEGAKSPRVLNGIDPRASTCLLTQRQYTYYPDHLQGSLDCGNKKNVIIDITRSDPERQYTDYPDYAAARHWEV